MLCAKILALILVRRGLILILPLHLLIKFWFRRRRAFDFDFQVLRQFSAFLLKLGDLLLYFSLVLALLLSVLPLVLVVGVLDLDQLHRRVCFHD